jgi:hypothetical protein
MSRPALYALVSSVSATPKRLTTYLRGTLGFGGCFGFDTQRAPRAILGWVMHRLRRKAGLPRDRTRDSRNMVVRERCRKWGTLTPPSGLRGCTRSPPHGCRVGRASIHRGEVHRIRRGFRWASRRGAAFDPPYGPSRTPFEKSPYRPLRKGAQVSWRFNPAWVNKDETNRGVRRRRVKARWKGSSSTRSIESPSCTLGVKLRTGRGP